MGGLFKKIQNRIDEIEGVLESVCPHSLFTKYHLDFIQQIIEREKGKPFLDVVKAYRKNLDDYIENTKDV